MYVSALSHNYPCMILCRYNACAADLQRLRQALVTLSPTVAATAASGAPPPPRGLPQAPADRWLVWEDDMAPPPPAPRAGATEGRGRGFGGTPGMAQLCVGGRSDVLAQVLQ